MNGQPIRHCVLPVDAREIGFGCSLGAARTSERANETWSSPSSTTTSDTSRDRVDLPSPPSYDDPVASQRVKSKPSKVQAPTKSPAARPSEAQAEVQRHWEEYWGRRGELEIAVRAVQEANRALEDARRREADVRQKFDEAKLALKQLLDVDPSMDVDDDSRTAPRLN
jgi:hypothetical protein